MKYKYTDSFGGDFSVWTDVGYNVGAGFVGIGIYEGKLPAIVYVPVSEIDNLVEALLKAKEEAKG